MRGKIKTNKIVMSIINKIEMETIITNDLDITSHSSIGEFLGSGGHRNVYMFNLIPNTVIKIEFRGFQNMTEHLISSELEYTIHNNSIARVKYISNHGRVSIQEYASDLEDSDIAIFNKTKYLNIFTDIKRENIGKIDNRIVFRDYGLVLLPDYSKVKKYKIKG